MTLSEIKLLNASVIGHFDIFKFLRYLKWPIELGVVLVPDEPYEHSHNDIHKTQIKTYPQ